MAPSGKAAPERSNASRLENLKQATQIDRAVLIARLQEGPTGVMEDMSTQLVAFLIHDVDLDQGTALIRRAGIFFLRNNKDVLLVLIVDADAREMSPLVKVDYIYIRSEATPTKGRDH